MDVHHAGVGTLLVKQAGRAVGHVLTHFLSHLLEPDASAKRGKRLAPPHVTEAVVADEDELVRHRRGQDHSQ